MKLRYAGTCAECDTTLAAGTTADYDRTAKVVRCVTCPPDVRPGVASVPELDAPAAPERLAWVVGVPGASAAEEHDRRHGARRERVLTDHPRTGKFRLALSDDAQSTKAWATGAEGERAVAESLQKLAGDTCRVIHDAGIPGSSANLDHLAITPTGVFMIDAKRYRGQRPALRVEGGLFSPRVEFLTVGGRNRTKMIEDMHRQVGLVREALADQLDVAVRGMLCFIDADWPLIGGSFQVQGVDVVYPRKMRAVLTEPGPLDADRIADLQWRLHQAFPRQ